MTTGTIDVIIGFDVGKTTHHACALTPLGEIIYDKPLPQDESHLRTVLTDLQAHGTVLVVVDQPNTIGALAVAVAWAPAARSACPAWRYAWPRTCTPRATAGMLLTHRQHGTHDAAHPAGRGPGRRGSVGAEDAFRIR